MYSNPKLTEKHLEDLFLADQFPSAQEVLDASGALERGDEKEISAVLRWRKGLYNRLHQRKYRASKKRFETSYSGKEAHVLKSKAGTFGMTPVKYIKHAALEFPLDYTPTLCKEDILACKSLLLKSYNVIKDLSRNPTVAERADYDAIAKEIRLLKERFEEIVYSSQ